MPCSLTPPAGRAGDPRHKCVLHLALLTPPPRAFHALGFVCHPHVSLFEKLGESWRMCPVAVLTPLRAKPPSLRAVWSVSDLLSCHCDLPASWPRWPLLFLKFPEVSWYLHSHPSPRASLCSVVSFSVRPTLTGHRASAPMVLFPRAQPLQLCRRRAIPSSLDMSSPADADTMGAGVSARHLATPHSQSCLLEHMAGCSINSGVRLEWRCVITNYGQAEDLA